MKKILFAAAVLAAACSKVPENQCQMEIDMTGLPDTLVVYVMKADLSEAETTDTIIAEKGRFAYSYAVESMRKGGVKTLDGAKDFAFYLFPGQKLKLTGDAATVYHLGGSDCYKEIDEALAVPDETTLEMRALNEEINKAAEAGQDVTEMTAKYKELAARIPQLKCEYIKAHPSSAGSVLLLSDLGIEYFAEYDAILTDKAKTGVMANIYKHAKAKYDKEQARLAAKEMMVEGNEAPDFSLTDIDGYDVSLSSLRGKYVIIDFWGSWCIWCIKGMPDMKAAYEKHRENLEILGVNCGDKEETWKNAVKELQLPWKHVINGKGDSDVTTNYAIEGYPTKVLIDPEGKIVKYMVGEDPAFYTMLDQVLQ